MESEFMDQLSPEKPPRVLAQQRSHLPSGQALEHFFQVVSFSLSLSSVLFPWARQLPTPPHPYFQIQERYLLPSLSGISATNQPPPRITPSAPS